MATEAAEEGVRGEKRLWPGPRWGWKHVLALGVGGAAGALALFVLIDVFDVLGLRTTLGRWYGGNLRLWVHLYENGGFVEWAQWGFLAATSILAASASGRLRLQGRIDHARFWGLLSLAAALMLIEDAGDPRHKLASHLVTLAGGRPRLELIGQLAGEALVFGLLAAPALAALWWLPSLRPRRTVWRLLLAGYAGYAVAALSSFLSSVRIDGVGWYHVVGRWIDEVVLGGRLIPYRDHTGFWIMDRPYEETFELVGAACLCAAVVAYGAVERVRDRSPSSGRVSDSAETPRPQG